MCACTGDFDLARTQEHGRVEMVHQGAGGANADPFREGMQTLAGGQDEAALAPHGGQLLHWA
jgi:hypothetical protein